MVVKREKKRKRKMSRRKKIIVSIVVVVLISALTYAGFVGAKLYQTMNKIQDDDFAAENDVELEKNENDDVVMVEKLVRDGNTISILIAGVDTEHGQFAGRSDVLMVAAIDLDNGESTLVSIPRDTYVEIAGKYEYDKINHAFAISPETSMKTVENYLDIPIDHYVAVNFTGFEQFIDFLGGIEIDVERTIYHNLHPERVYLYPGVQRVNGSNALQYVRFRNDGEGDFGRNRRQQQVVKAVLDQTMSLRTVTGITEVLDIVGDNVRTSMDIQTMIRLATNLSSLTGDNVETLRLTGEGMNIDGIYYVDVLEEERAKVSEALKERLRLEYKMVAEGSSKS